MTPDEGMMRLVHHAEAEEGSFLYMLRPYSGLNEVVMKDVLDALRAAGPILSADRPPRELISAVWAISHYGRSWALAPDGMLRRNHLLNEADLAKLDAFLESFDDAVMSLLDGNSPEEAFAAVPEPSK